MRFGLLLLVLSLAACSDDGMTRKFGLSRDAAPTTIAATQMPLSTPPSLAQRPTRAGAAAPRRLRSNSRRPAAPDRTLWCRPSGPAATADVRQLIDENSGMIEPGAEFTDRLMNWTPQPGFQVDERASEEGVAQQNSLAHDRPDWNTSFGGQRGSASPVRATGPPGFAPRLCPSRSAWAWLPRRHAEPRQPEERSHADRPGRTHRHQPSGHQRP